MRPRLLYPDQDLDVDTPLPPGGLDLVTDLDLETLFSAMSGGDTFLHDVVQQVVLTSMTDPAEIAYRQDALRDALDNVEVVRHLYRLAEAGIASEEEVYPGLGRSSSSSLHRSVQLIEAMLEVLRHLRDLATSRGSGFTSAAFTGLVSTLETELDDGFFDAVEDQMERLRFPGGVVVGARLGRGGRGTDHVLREPPLPVSWTKRVASGPANVLSFEVPERDRAGTKSLADLRERGQERIAWTMERSSQHLHGFFEVLRRELGFYVGCIRLHEQLTAKGEPICFPTVSERDEPTFVASGLYDAGLALRLADGVVSNDVAAEGKLLVLATGANQGGKSTFLRSVGQAQLMMQSGMFVAAASLEANPCQRVFTHFKRGEDRTMQSGKLDEELGRVSHIVDELEPGSLVLLNESFASTNEHEGSQIAQGIVRALLEARVKVVFVTHGYDLAASITRDYREVGLFLRAERREDGQRTYQLFEGEPLTTSYGLDLYERVFGDAAAPSGDGSTQAPGEQRGDGR